MNAISASAYSVPRPIRTADRLDAEVWQNRAIALAVLLPQIAVLGIALWLTPNPNGLGTHMELGLPPCGFLLATGYPCATCGMTTAFTWAAHGHLIESFLTQPAGAVLCMMSTMTALISLYAIFTGISLLPLWKFVWRSRFIGMMILMILVAWAYKVAVYSMHVGH